MAATFHLNSLKNLLKNDPILLNGDVVRMSVLKIFLSSKMESVDPQDKCGKFQ